MAVVINEETVRAFAENVEVTEGRTLLADGAVTGVEDQAHRVRGSVRDGSGAVHGVWAQVVGRELTAECDGPCTPAPGRLCRHAVALALYAVDQNLPWRTESAGGDDRHLAPGAARAALTGPEKAAVLDRLLADHPELHAEADELAIRVLAPSNRDELAALQEQTAGEVERGLRELDITQMSTGYQPGHGFVDEYEATRVLIEPVITPYEDDVRRRLGLGMVDAAEAVALGVLDGLDACEGNYDGDELLCYAGEDLSYSYGYTIRDLLHGMGRAVDE